MPNVDSCPGLSGVDPIDNVMSYSSCNNKRFTSGQVDRAWATLRRFFPSTVTPPSSSAPEELPCNPHFPSGYTTGYMFSPSPPFFPGWVPNPPPATPPTSSRPSTPFGSPAPAPPLASSSTPSGTGTGSSPSSSPASSAPPPAGGTSSSPMVSFALIVAGSPEDYSAGARGAMKSDIASLAQVDTGAVLMTFSAASVRVDVSITTTSASQAEAIMQALVAPLSSTSSAAAIFTSTPVQVESVATRPSSISAPTSSSDGLSTGALVGIIAGAAVLVLAAAALFCRYNRRSAETEPKQMVEG